VFHHGNVARRAANSGAILTLAALTLAVTGLVAGAPGASAAAVSGPGTPAAVTPATGTPATGTPAAGPPAAVTPTAFTAPAYTCTVTSGAHSANRTARIPIQLRDTGPGSVGSTDAVTLSSPGTALGGPFPAGTSTVSFSGALPVMGAQISSVPLSGIMTDTGNGLFSLGGRLMLTAAGLDHILPPTRFTVTVRAASVISVVVTCVVVTAMTATMPASVALRVTAAAGMVPLTAGATPAGAPGTGGGGSLHHAGDLAGLAAGGAVLLAGLVITVAGLRRRRQSPA
jgi:hypothetical protein